ncbi:MAG: hypothetical protein JWO07_146 [Candidatus Saccharibacteria bacterium]|nr:hypothetical protein [Candidatus Saccharibacteria bacterium]
MKIAHPSSKKRLIFISLAVLVIAGVGIGVYALRQSQQTASITKSSPSSSLQPGVSTVSLNPPTDAEVQAGQDAKAQTVNPPSSSGDTQTNDLNAVANYTGTSVQVRTTISANVSDGSCSLTLTKGSTVVTKANVGIQALSGYSTCKGWDIPVSELSSGTWTAKVTTSYQSKTSVATAVVAIP